MEKKKLSIVIPFRDRDEHLKVFIEKAPNIIGENNFDILVVEQFDDKLFNRAKLLNIGFEHNKNVSDYFCFHDVDMIPVEVDYSYPEKPYHLFTRAINQFEKVYPGYYGGVNIFNKEDFIKINGYSNEFWGWGGEDDDLLHRVRKCGWDLFRKNGVVDCLNDKNHTTTYQHHDNYQNNVNRLRVNYDYNLEGLNTLKYELVETIKLNDFTELIKVKI